MEQCRYTYVIHRLLRVTSFACVDRFCRWLQEPVLFAETIFYNIAFGLRRGEADATLAQVRARLLVQLDVSC